MITNNEDRSPPPPKKKKREKGKIPENIDDPHIRSTNKFYVSASTV